MRIDMWTWGYRHLSVRARKVIQRLGLTTDMLVDFESVKGCGPKTAAELRAFLAQLKRRPKQNSK